MRRLLALVLRPLTEKLAEAQAAADETVAWLDELDVDTIYPASKDVTP